MLEVANEHPNDFNYRLDLGNGTLELVREHCIGSLDVQEMSNCIGWVTNWLRSDKRKFNFTATALELLCLLRLNHTREMLRREMTPQTPTSTESSSLLLANDNTPPTSSISTSNNSSSLSLADDASILPRSRSISLGSLGSIESDELLMDEPEPIGPNETWSDLYVPLLRDAAGRLSLTESNTLRATVDTAAGENGFCARVITSVRRNWFAGGREALRVHAQEVQLLGNHLEEFRDVNAPLDNWTDDQLKRKFRQALIAAGAPDNFAQEYIPPHVQNLFINSFTMLSADFDNLANPKGNPASCIAMRAIDVIRREQSVSNRADMNIGSDVDFTCFESDELLL